MVKIARLTINSGTTPFGVGSLFSLDNVNCSATIEQHSKIRKRKKRRTNRIRSKPLTQRPIFPNNQLIVYSHAHFCSHQ